MQIGIILKKNKKTKPNPCSNLLVILSLYMQFFHLCPFISISVCVQALAAPSCASAEIISVAQAKGRTQQQQYLCRRLNFGDQHFHRHSDTFSLTGGLQLTTCLAFSCVFQLLTATSASIFMALQALSSGVVVNPVLIFILL